MFITRKHLPRRTVLRGIDRSADGHEAKPRLANSVFCQHRRGVTRAPASRVGHQNNNNRNANNNTQ